jgi:hypothetical protein
MVSGDFLVLRSFTMENGRRLDGNKLHSAPAVAAAGLGGFPISEVRFGDHVRRG